MARSNLGVSAARTGSSKARLVLGTAVASLALASCASSAPPAEVSFTKAQSALETWPARLKAAAGSAPNKIALGSPDGDVGAVQRRHNLSQTRLQARDSAFTRRRGWGVVHVAAIAAPVPARVTPLGAPFTKIS